MRLGGSLRASYGMVRTRTYGGKRPLGPALSHWPRPRTEGVFEDAIETASSHCHLGLFVLWLLPRL